MLFVILFARCNIRPAADSKMLQVHKIYSHVSIFPCVHSYLMNNIKLRLSDLSTTLCTYTKILTNQVLLLSPTYRPANKPREQSKKPQAPNSITHYAMQASIHTIKTLYSMHQSKLQNDLSV
jgi:hypothetical protein